MEHAQSVAVTAGDASAADTCTPITDTKKFAFSRCVSCQEIAWFSPKVKRRAGLVRSIAILALGVFAAVCEATVVDSGPVNIPVPETASGVSLDVITGNYASQAPLPAGWDIAINSAAGGIAVLSNATSAVASSSGAPLALLPGNEVGSANTFVGGSLAANAFRRTGTLAVGFRFVNEITGATNYGFVQLRTTAPNGFPATVTRYYYENSGAALVVPGYSRLFQSGFEGAAIAADCSAGAVQAALNAVPDGGTVQIPAGTCDWGASRVTTTKSVRFRGAGAGLTTFLRTAPVTEVEVNAGTQFMLTFDCQNTTKQVEISDVSLQGNDSLQSEADRLVDNDNGLYLANSCVDFRIHDVDLRDFSIAALTVRGANSRGVVYWSDFISNFKCQPDPLSCEGYGVVIYGDANQAWPALSLGSNQAVFVEDSYLDDNRHNVASNQASRYVLRHSTMVTTQRTRNFGMVDAHGRNPSYPPGSRSWEVYRNTFKTRPLSMIATGISMRGGDGVIFGNSFNASTFSGQLRANIPAIAWLTDESGCTAAWPVTNQTREAYLWDNDWRGPPPGYEGPAVRVGSSCVNHIRENSEFFLSPRPSYTPYIYPHPLR
ncbi:MAG: hypothetical protein JNN30_15865 [Rhodanobacteraceae bacterium]|nr:hypothetical protein [Rhodanobacteraceae bacterium]